jgi:hypothetical protein
MGLVDKIRDATQEVGYAAQKKAGQYIEERHAYEQKEAIKKLTPEYQSNDAKLKAGKISKEMHEERAQRLDREFQTRSTPIEQRVGRTVKQEATNVFEMSQGKPGAENENTFSAQFVRGAKKTSEKLHDIPPAPEPWIFSGATSAPNRKEFGGGKGTRKYSPTKGTVIAKGKAPGVNFSGAGGGFGSPLNFGGGMSGGSGGSPFSLGGGFRLFGRGDTKGKKNKR